MSRTTDDLHRINEALNQVQSAGQVKAAIGAALRALSAAYPLAADLPGFFNSDIEARLRNELDIARTNLEHWYSKIKVSGAEDYSAEWAKGRNLVIAAYTTIAGVEGTADYVPRTSNWEILLTSIKEAPGVFGKGVGDVAAGAGDGIVDLILGLFKGLGIKGVIYVAVGFAVFLFITNPAALAGAARSARGVFRAG